MVSSNPHHLVFRPFCGPLSHHFWNGLRNQQNIAKVTLWLLRQVPKRYCYCCLCGKPTMPWKSTSHPWNRIYNHHIHQAFTNKFISSLSPSRSFLSPSLTKIMFLSVPLTQQLYTNMFHLFLTWKHIFPCDFHYLLISVSFLFLSAPSSTLISLPRLSLMSWGSFRSHWMCVNWFIP